MANAEGRDERPRSSAETEAHSQVNTTGAANSELPPLNGSVSVSSCAGTWTRPSHIP